MRGKLLLSRIVILATSTLQTCSSCSTCLKMKVHIKARGSLYPTRLPNEKVSRFTVPDDKVDWAVEWPEYEPVDFTSHGLKGMSWADHDINDPDFQPKWNEEDGSINRESYNGKYNVVDGCPRNPIGRTGIVGRGCLGRWGPNHAADPIVTRWKRKQSGAIDHNKQTGNPILQFVAIQRRDSLEWAIPGGMVDPGETIVSTLKREFGEEALNTLEIPDDEKSKVNVMIEELFNRGKKIYKGYVDDPRNTDNAWMETVAVNFHDEEGNSVGRFPLHAGDDAVGVKWFDVDSKLSLYASHIEFLEKVAKLHQAHW